MGAPPPLRLWRKGHSPALARATPAAKPRRGAPGWVPVYF